MSICDLLWFFCIFSHFTHTQFTRKMSNSITSRVIQKPKLNPFNHKSITAPLLCPNSCYCPLSFVFYISARTHHHPISSEHFFSNFSRRKTWQRLDSIPSRPRHFPVETYFIYHHSSTSHNPRAEQKERDRISVITLIQSADIKGHGTDFSSYVLRACRPTRTSSSTFERLIPRPVDYIWTAFFRLEQSVSPITSFMLWLKNNLSLLCGMESIDHAWTSTTEIETPSCSDFLINFHEFHKIVLASIKFSTTQLTVTVRRGLH